MVKTKKDAFGISLKTQKVFAITALVAYLLNAIFWLILLMQVYAPRGGVRLSPFTAAVAGEVLLPVIPFVLAYLFQKKESQTFTRIFQAIFFAVIAAFIQLIVAVIYREATQYEGEWGILVARLIPLVIFVLLLFWLFKKTASGRESTTRLVFMTLAILAYASNAILTIRESNFSYFLDTATLSRIFLPILFFVLACYFFQGTGQKVQRLFNPVVYTVIGSSFVYITSSLCLISARLLSGYSYFQEINPELIVVCLSLVAYGALIMRYGQPARQPK